jgi:tetratricopeptide (TPR) repeat protein
MDTGRDEIQAWIAFAEGNNNQAEQIMRKVADKQDTYGKGEVEIPAREMLADMLLESNQPEKALAEYQASLKIDPNRFNGLYGAARAAQIAKQPALADKYYSQLVKNCEGATSDRPELARARAELSGKTVAGGN